MQYLIYAECALGGAGLLVALLGGGVILQRRNDGAGRLMGWSALILFIGYILYVVRRALAGLTGTEGGFWLLTGRMLAALAVTVFCVLLSLLWEKLYAQQNGFFAEMHIRELSGVRALGCLFPVVYWLAGHMGGEAADPMAGATLTEALAAPAVRCATLLVIVAVVARHWYKTRAEIPTLKTVWLALVLSMLFGVAADVGAVFVPALELLWVVQFACLLWIVVRFLRYAGETGDLH